jgi:hypothetical protein
MGGPGLRFALEAAFLIALAVAAGLAELSATTIVLVMAAGWLLVAAIEWLAWREGPRVTYAAREQAAPPAPPPEAEPVAVEAEADAEPRRRRFWRRRKQDVGEPEEAPEAGEDTQDLPPPVDEPARAEERAAG